MASVRAPAFCLARKLSVLTLLLAAGVGAAKEPPLSLTPSGAWVMNYAPDSCHLARTFGEGDQAVSIEFRKFSPSDRFELLVAGKTLASQRTDVLVTEFGPGGGPEQHPNALQGQMSDGRTVLEMTAMLFPKDEKAQRSWKAEQDPAPLDTEAEARITELRISGPIPRPLVFQLGPMGKPLDAMRACLDELMTHWGIDAAAHHSLTRAAAPASNPQNWISPGYFPENMLKQHRSGTVHFRLMVDTQGKPTGCVVQTGDDAFNNLTCTALMKRARFTPALDANGKPIPSYYANAVHWLG